MSVELILAALSGSIVGTVLGLVGGGGSILAVPLLIYVVGIGSTHVALGTSAIAVAGSALAGIVPHWRAGNIKWNCALVFSGAGVAGAIAGSGIAKATDGALLLVLFSLLMIGVGIITVLQRGSHGDASVALTSGSALRLAPPLVGIGLAVGALSGFFGIGGGFLIVPGLMLATGMPMINAIGTSLISVFAFGAATAGNYAISGLVDWPIAVAFVGGGAIGGLVGVGVGRLLSARRNALRYVFAATVTAVGAFILWQSLPALSAG